MESNQHRSCYQDGGRCNCTEAFDPLNELREMNLFCDAVLRLEDGGVFPVHRVILSMRSEYFRNLFTTTQHTNEETDIHLHGVSSDMMTQILDYVYFRDVDIRSDNARQLLETAEYLRVPGVTELCCDFLKDATDNSIDIMYFARSHSCANVENHARRLVLRHFVEVSQQSEELLELPVEELQAIIESDELNVKDERVVWECILRWINHDPDNRKNQIAGLLKCVRLGLPDSMYILKEIALHPYVIENLECRPVISKTLVFLDDLEMMTKEYKEFVIPRIGRPRIPQDILFAIGGVRDRRVTDVIEAYDVRADRWSVVEGVDSIGPRAHHGTAVIGFDIYVIGGTDNGFDGLTSCRCFNAVTKTCREVAAMNARRARLMVAVLRGVVYAMGGYEVGVDQRTAERYDCKTNQWSWIAPMNTGRSSTGAAVLNDKIYVAGGHNRHGCLNLVEVYDPDTNQWTFVAPMLSGRANFSCVEFHGCLYALGGYDGISDALSTEKYDPAEDTWTEIPGMSVYSDYFKAEVIDDRIFVIGGRCKGKTHFNIKCYDDKENRWYPVTNMNVSRSLLSTCVIKNLPNASNYAHKLRDELIE